jgi:hypothetical protein
VRQVNSRHSLRKIPIYKLWWNPLNSFISRLLKGVGNIMDLTSFMEQRNHANCHSHCDVKYDDI